jgi:ABC-type multidrug transport system fused ATPase/permease subunit
MLSIVPVVTLAAVGYGRYLKKLRKQYQDELARSGTTAEEAISNIRTVRAFSNETALKDMYSSDIARSFKLGRKMTLAGASFFGVLTLVSEAAIALVLWYGGTLVIEERMTTGTLTSFLLYTLTLGASRSSLLPNPRSVFIRNAVQLVWGLHAGRRCKRANFPTHGPFSKHPSGRRTKALFH